MNEGIGLQLSSHKIPHGEFPKKEGPKMAGQRQPIELILAKGKKHVTKDEIDKRSKTEIKAPSDDVRPPSHLTPAQKREFKKYAKQLLDIGIMSNLDCESLARFIIAKDLYVAVSKHLVNLISSVNENGSVITAAALGKMEAATNLQDKYFKQCEKVSSALGLTISSRCRLVLPEAPKKEVPKTPEEKLFGGVV